MARRKQSSTDWQENIDEVMQIAWGHAAAAMRTIAEAAADGDIAAAYYLVNRTIGRPVEADRQQASDDYGQLLRDLRNIRPSGEGSPDADSKPGGAPAPVEAGGVPPKRRAVRSPRKPSETEVDSGRRTSWEELLSGDGADSEAPPR